MPLFIHLANIVIRKSTIRNKYFGGIQQFKKDFNFSTMKHNDEDDELYLIAYMNLDHQDIQLLIDKGLHFSSETQYSEDFVIVFRYGGPAWIPDWLESNTTFVWHKDCKPNQKEKAEKIDQTTVDEITEAFERGEKPFATIKS